MEVATLYLKKKKNKEVKMRQYPIWIDVKACIYENSKSYGAKDVNDQTIKVGSSKSNSVEHVNMRTTRRVLNEYKGHENVVVFQTRVDDQVVAETIFKNKNGKAGLFICQNKIKDLI